MTNLRLAHSDETNRRQDQAERARMVSELARQCLAMAKTLGSTPTDIELQWRLFEAEHYALIRAQELEGK